MATEWLVDTNVLIDIIHEDPLFAEASTQALERCAEQGILVINPIIYGEVGAICDSLEELDSLLSLGLFRRDPLIWEASFLAGQAFRRYRKNGGQKQRVLADFFNWCTCECSWIWLDLAGYWLFEVLQIRTVKSSRSLSSACLAEPVVTLA